MLESPDPEDHTPPPTSPSFLTDVRHRWKLSDLVIFSIFFSFTVLFLPLGAFQIMRMFRPSLRITDLTTVDQIMLQGVMDLVLVGFILFLIKTIHGRSFIETIHWHRAPQFRTGLLVSTGATLAITVLLVSSLFPTPNQTPIERMISSTRSLYVFAIFGIAVAPLFEEIIFRGFLFKVFDEMNGPGLAVPATALLFALLHSLQLWGNWAAILLIFGVGYVLAFIRNRSGSVIPGLIVHTAYNAMLFAMYAVSTFVQKGVKG
jgi:uncharacterized protein